MGRIIHSHISICQLKSLLLSHTSQRLICFQELHQQLGRFRECLKLTASRKVQGLIFVLATSFAGPATYSKLAVIAYTEHPPDKAHPAPLRVQLSYQPSQIRPRPDSKLVAVNPPEFPSFTSAFMWQTSLPSISSTLCFHALTNPFSRNSLLFTFIQNPGGFTDCHAPNRFRHIRSPNNSRVLFGLPPLDFSLVSFCEIARLFSMVCRLFSQNAGGGGIPTVDFSASAALDEGSDAEDDMQPKRSTSVRSTKIR